MEVYLIRHTSPDIAPGTCYGQLDIPALADSFDAELALIRQKLPATVDSVYSSPLIRCAQLARHLYNSEIITDKRLMEMNFGAWEGQQWASLEEAAFTRWTNNFASEAVPDGESYKQLYARCESFINDKIAYNTQGTSAIVTHAGNIRSMLAWLLEMPLETTFRIGLSYGCVVHLHIEAEKYACRLMSIV